MDGPAHGPSGAWASLRPHLLTSGCEGDKIIGFRAISGIISVLMLISVIFPLLWSRERYTKVNRTHVNLWKALRATLKCRPFVVILVINIAKTAGTLPRNLFFFVGTYYVCFGDMEVYSRYMGGHIAVWGLGVSILVWLATKSIMNSIGKRAAFIWGAALALAQAIGTPFVATPGHLRTWFWFNVAFLPFGLILDAATRGIMPDICDIDELEHGERREGLFTAVQSFVSKMEISVMTLLTGVFIAWTGFSADYGVHQPQWILKRMHFMAFTPLIVISAIAFVVSCFMPITAKMMDRVRAELDARHDSAIAPSPQ